MSTIKFSIQASGIGAGYVYERIRFSIDYGSGNVILPLENIDAVAPIYKYRSIDDGISGADYAQAQSYSQSFNRDYKNVGGNNNLSAIVEDDPVSGDVYVIVTSRTGIFSDFSSLGFASLEEIDNSPLVDPLVLSATRSTTGTCTTIQYSVSASGGISNYVLKNGTTIIDSDWDGSSQNINLNRGTQANLSITDSDGAIKQIPVNVPRKLAIGEFQESLTQYVNSADVLVQNTNPVNGTTPLQYAITDVGDSVGSDYQSSNTFPGVLSGQYRLWVKDVYGCEISKIIDIPETVDPDQTTVAPYFEICEGQSLIASELVSFDKDNPKNYFNSGSYNQRTSERYLIKQPLLSSDIVGMQFKSSFDWHYITLHKCNGEKIDLPSIMIQENLGIAERVDCELFPINGQTGVWFNGGNSYEPDTTTVIGSSNYNKTTPAWNQIGQFVSIVGKGTYEIVSNGYDDAKGGYFVLDFSVSGEESTQAQATYNAQEYNLFEFYFQANLLDDTGFIVVERAFDGDGDVVGNPWIIEKMKIVDFNEDMLKLEWSDPKNRGGIVFQSGITFFKRCHGEFNPLWDNESDTYKGDESEFSLEQSSYLDFEIIIEGINQKEVTQLNIASGLEGFKCNGVLLVRKSPPEITRMDKSNLYRWKCEFAYGENNLAVKQDEIVLNVGTGVVGGGGDNPAPDLSGIQLYIDSDGNLIKFGSNITKV